MADSGQLPTHSSVEKAVHTAARMLCYFRNRDWRYDPGEPQHDHWRVKAEQVVAAVQHPALGLDRLVSLRDVVEAIQATSALDYAQAAKVAAAIKREFGEAR